MHKIPITRAERFLCEKVTSQSQEESFLFLIEEILDSVNTWTNHIVIPPELCTSSWDPVIYDHNIASIKWYTTSRILDLVSERMDCEWFWTELQSLSSSLFHAFINYICIQNATEINRLSIDDRDWYKYRIEKGPYRKMVSSRFGKTKSQSDALLEIIKKGKDLEHEYDLLKANWNQSQERNQWVAVVREWVDMYWISERNKPTQEQERQREVQRDFERFFNQSLVDNNKFTI